MPLSALGRNRQVVDANGMPTQLLQLFSEQILSWMGNPEITVSITLSGIGSRIYGDFGGTPESNRVLFQTTILNGVTAVGAIPNGTSQTSSFKAYNSSDPNNACFAQLIIDQSSANVRVDITGTGSYLPLNFTVGGSTRLQVDTSGNFSPLADNAYTCGKSGMRFSAFWGANGTIQTSDERTKKDIEPCVLGLDFINYLEPISYKFIVGGNDVTPGETEDDDPIITPRAGVRTHWGFSAQHVKQIADIFGVDFGGHVLTDINDKESQQGLRMDQFICPLVKAIQEQSAIIDQLTARIEALENE